jgi:hypothetical protein
VADSLDAVHTRAERLARGWLVGAFATGVAAVSHTLAGGYRPDALGLISAAVFAGMLGTLAIGRRPSLPRLSIAVAGSQLAFHILFVSLAAPGAAHADDPTATMSGMPGMQMPGMQMPGMQMPFVTVAPSHVVDHLTSPSMWVAHAIAGVLTILFLRRAETAVWGMLRRLVVRVLRPVIPVPIARRAATPVIRVRVLRPVARIVAPPLRGPPFLPSH